MSNTTTPAPAATPAGRGHDSPARPAAAVSFRARRRSPGMAALAAALISAGGMGGFLAWQETGQRTAVLAVAREVAPGDVIEDADLVDAAVSLDPALAPLRAGDRGDVVGKRAAVALTPGALLSQGHVTDRALVAEGQQLVGIGLKASQLPATRLSSGDAVVVVFTPPDSAQATGGKDAQAAEPRTVAARVVRVGESEGSAGAVTVDVAVTAAEGPGLAAQAASGRVALVVDAGGRP
ncbi:SAF domain-containing protein [Streptomyces sp. NPDC051907]|uniref:SAF domain-containing protein n=1 Tax=Streptomyces sp. NPDC051907 TaxID=3155284 RepID=UPI00344AC3F3